MKIQGKQGSAMPKHRRFLFDDGDSWSFPFPFRARHIFVSVCTNCLNVALLCSAQFSQTSIKNVTRAKSTRLVLTGPMKTA